MPESLPDPLPEPPSFTPFTDLNAVPDEIALHQGARLSLEQINELILRAYELGSNGLPNLGTAWEEFRGTHQIENTLWVKNSGNPT